MSQPKEQTLVRSLSLGQATAINMIDMVGIGPFVTLSFIVGAMQGSASLLAWLLGALLAYTDGIVWAELGAAWPEAGGSYVFLGKIYGKFGLGKLMPFLFIWQTVIQAPLVIASGAIGFAGYFKYLVPVSELGEKCVSGTLVILLIFLLYRNIKSIGKISVVLWVITGGTILWLVFSAIGKFHMANVVNFNLSGFKTSQLLFVALGQASLKAVYSYLGYYNVCHLGAEIKNPARNIPRSIIISITGISILYICMQSAVVGVLPVKDIIGSKFVASLYFETVYHSHTVGIVATVLILIIGASALFAGILGYSRIPYAAALNGDFFKIFAKVHPKHNFPHFSLLFIGTLGFIFSLLFRLGDVISAILMMRILIQFISQAVGLIALRYKFPAEPRPYKMPLFPIPAIVSVVLWLFIFCMNDVKFIVGALGIIVTGVIAFYIRNFLQRKQNAVN